MKTRLIYLGTILAVVLCALFFTIVDKNQETNRYWQHKEEITKQPVQTDEFTTHLPIISVDTFGKELTWFSSEGYLYDEGNHLVSETKYESFDKEQITVSCAIEIRDQQGDWNTLQDTPQVSDMAKMRIRGNSSKHFDKKSFFLKFVDENDRDKNVSVMGMSEASEWVLNGPVLDRTLLRNYLCYNISGEIMEYAPNVRFCELFVNQEYRGVYLMVEAITKNPGRIQLTKSENGKALTSWIIRLDRDYKADRPLNHFSFYTYHAGVSQMDMLYPGLNTYTPERQEFVEDELSKIERSIYSADLSDKKKGYQNYLDLDEFASYFIIQEFFGNMDAGRFSTYYYKDVRGKVKPVVWDFNNACDNYLTDTHDATGFSLDESTWYGQLIHDKTFVDHVIKKYRYLRKNKLSDAYILNNIDEAALYLKDARLRNYQIYDYVFHLTKADPMTDLVPLERNYTSYEASVEQLKNWIVMRGAWLDEHIDTLQQYCQDSKNMSQIIE